MRRFVVLGYAMQLNVFITSLLSPALSSTVVEERENQPACHVPSYSTLYSTENSEEPIKYLEVQHIQYVT
jgi:hypothetical protein